MNRSRQTLSIYGHDSVVEGIAGHRQSLVRRKKKLSRQKLLPFATWCGIFLAKGGATFAGQVSFVLEFFTRPNSIENCTPSSLGGFYRRTHRSRRHPCMDTTRWLKESPVIIISLFPQKECFVLVKVLVFVVRALRRPPQVFSPQQIKIPPQNSRQEIGQEQNKHHEDEKARDKQQEEPLHPHHHLQQQQHHQQHYGAASS